MIIRRTALLLGVGLLAACSHDTVQTETLVVESQDECPLRLNVGQPLTLTLPSNPSTGYRWRVENAGAEVLTPLGPEVYSNPEAGGMVGSAGQSTWRFRARQAGEGRLLLVYPQPWDTQAAAAETFDCQLSVH